MGRGMTGGNRLGTGVIDGAKFELAPSIFLRGIAVAMFLGQIAFVFITGQGGATLSGSMTLINFIVAVVWVVFTSAMQWGCRRDFAKWWWMYFIFLGLSVIPTVYGFWIVGGYWAAGIVGDPTGALILSIIVLAAFDILQEIILVN